MILLYLFLFLLVFSHVQGLRHSVLFDMKKQPTSLGKCLALSLSLSLSLSISHTHNMNNHLQPLGLLSSSVDVVLPFGLFDFCEINLPICNLQLSKKWF